MPLRTIREQEGKDKKLGFPWTDVPGTSGKAPLEQGLKEDQEALRGPSTLAHSFFKRWSLTSLSTGFGNTI